MTSASAGSGTLREVSSSGRRVDDQARNRRTALLAGVFFIITFVASIPAGLFLYNDVLDHANFIVGAGGDFRVQLGALLEVITVIANIGTAVVPFPILKRQNEGVALGYVASRIVESTVIAVGIIASLRS